MNPDLVYSRYRDEALAQQFTAAEYTTFVAMPFVEKHSYRSRAVFDGVIVQAVNMANEAARDRNLRPFAPPHRVDLVPGVARQITDEILRIILQSHFVIGDLTMNNDGVLLEIGVALSLKPNDRITLITQGRVEDLHFDLKGKNTISYNSDDGVFRLRDALISSAESFEDDRDRLLTDITSRLTTDAVHVLNWAGQTGSGKGQTRPRQITEESPPPWFHRQPSWDEVDRVEKHAIRARMSAAVRELLDKGLLRTDYKPQVLGGDGLRYDASSYGPTKLGWRVIEQLWPAIDGAPGLREPPL